MDSPTAREILNEPLEGGASLAMRLRREETQDDLSRQYHAADFSRWSVTEIAGNVLARPGQRCLIFASAEAVRRVWTYPVHWRDMTDIELEALSWGQ